MKSLFRKKTRAERKFQMSIAGFALLGITVSLIIVALVNGFNTSDNPTQNYEVNSGEQIENELTEEGETFDNVEPSKTELFDKVLKFDDDDEIFSGMNFSDGQLESTGIEKRISVKTYKERQLAKFALKYAVYVLDLRQRSFGSNYFSGKFSLDCFILENVKVLDRKPETNEIEFEIEIRSVAFGDGDSVVEDVVWYNVRVWQNPNGKTAYMIHRSQEHNYKMQATGS